MKKYFLSIIALIALWSCQTDEQYEQLNRDPKNPTQVQADFLFTSATVALADQLATPNVNLNAFRFLAQYFTTTTYLDEPNYRLGVRNVPQNHWSRIYTNVIFDLQNARELVQEDTGLSEGEKSARLGQIEVMEVYAWQVLVDTFGDIPYTEALNAKEFPLPAYDDDQAIYQDLISRLSAVRTNLQAGQGFAGSDPVYGGDMEKWQKFANSLLLRLGMRIADVNPELSKTTAEAAIAGGVFASNDDSALIQYESNPPNTNPLWEDLVQSGRSDYLAANTIIDIMNELDDPRRDDYFDTNLPEFIGGVYGGSNNFGEYTHVGAALEDPTHPGILIDYSEVEFYQAEAIERGYTVTGTAEEHFNAAITASILYWGGTEAEASAYLSQSGVAYSSANWEEQIGTQFWLAMYDNPFQGWSVWRKYDAPELNQAADTEDAVPLRYVYPTNEQNLNFGQYSAASEAIGGDAYTTPVFWDVQ